MEIDKFNIRVYGIAFQAHKVLLCKEWIGSHEMVKFPGGGLELGEGLIAGLEREIEEEMGQRPSIGKHIYTTEHFVPSAFKQNEQLISVYYEMQLLQEFTRGKQSLNDHHFIEFFWADVRENLSELLSFPIDQLVAEMLRNRMQGK
jgi:8-oxo-dGTP pyrophosphatase MutT (NUDIX family)